MTALDPKTMLSMYHFVLSSFCVSSGVSPGTTDGVFDAMVEFVAELVGILGEGSAVEFVCEVEGFVEEALAPITNSFPKALAPVESLRMRKNVWPGTASDPGIHV